MKNLIRILIFVFILAIFLNCGGHRKITRSSDLTHSINNTNFVIDSQHIELPAYNKSDEIVRHTAYTLDFSDENKEAKWVAYRLTKDHVGGKEPRTNNFRPDPKVKTGSAIPQDYKHSGYDRGHLAPAADMSWSEQTISESFFMSNMTPQKPGFNRGIWKNLEDRVRNWAIENETLYVVTGPILQKGLPTIGTDNVSVPEYFFKVVLDYTAKDSKAIGFIMKNESSKMPLGSFAVTVDSVETLTGINFFPTLPDSLEKKIEGNINLEKWSLNTD
jgi:endonuclease G